LTASSSKRAMCSTIISGAWLLTRLSAFGGALFIGNLWLGLYQVEAEWPWSYFFLIMLLAIFCFDAYGRSLGCDALVRGDKTIERRLPKFIRVFT